MTIETDLERATMLADFGELVIYSPGAVWPDRAGSAVNIKMIFDADYLTVDGESVRTNSNNPVCLARTSDVDGIVRNSMIERATGADYKVVSYEPDGTGFTLVELEGPR